MSTSAPPGAEHRRNDRTDWGTLWGRIDQLTQQVQALVGVVGALPTWQDLRMIQQEATNRYLDRGVYEIAHKDVQDQISEYHKQFDSFISEQRGSVGRMLPWLSLIVSGCSTLITLAVVGATGLVWLITHVGGH